MPRHALRCSVAIGIVIALVSVALAQNPRILDRAEAGVWSSAGKYLWAGPTAVADHPHGGRAIVVASPDASITTRATNIELTLVDRKNAMRFARTSVPIASLAEVLWAPDSTAFALTHSDGGWIGTWSVKVYHLGADGVSESSPSGLALSDFKQRFPGCPDEYLNVAAVRWLNGSQRLGLVVEVPCHSSCSDMCKVAGYLVDPVRGTIVERLSEKAVRSRWKAALGSRLRSK